MSRTSQPSTNPVKFAEPRPFSDPEAAVRKLIEIANAAEAVQDGRIYIERVNGPFLAAGGSPAEYRAGIERAIAKAGCGDTNPGPTSNSPTPAPSCSPDEMANLMPDKGWRRHFEEPIPLPEEMAAKAAAGLLSRFPVAARSAGTR